MKFALQRFGAEPLEIKADNIITFPAGLLGFETCTQFQMLHEEGKPTVFWLQSLDDPAVMFSLSDPARLNISYEVTLTDAEQALLEAAQNDELILAVILFKDADDAQLSGVKANMRAPSSSMPASGAACKKYYRNSKRRLRSGEPKAPSAATAWK